INSRLGHPSFEYPGSVGAGPRQVATEQGPQEAILKELSRHEPRNQQAISSDGMRDMPKVGSGADAQKYIKYPDVRKYLPASRTDPSDWRTIKSPEELAKIK